MKQIILIVATTSVVTLAIVFGIRASTDALAVIIGVVLGVVASVPTTFLITYMLTRTHSNQASAPPQHFSPHPPVVVINATDKPGLSMPPTLPAPGPVVQGRRWTVIGDTDTDDAT
jgi:hypothetical protein